MPSIWSGKGDPISKNLILHPSFRSSRPNLHPPKLERFYELGNPIERGTGRILARAAGLKHMPAGFAPVPQEADVARESGESAKAAGGEITSSIPGRLRWVKSSASRSRKVAYVLLNVASASPRSSAAAGERVAPLLLAILA